MAFPDFGNNRQAAQGPSTQAPTRSVESLPVEVKTQAVEAARPAAQLMEKATQHRTQESAVPSDHSGGKEALRHNQSSVDKTQAPMSPTDAHKGHAHSRGMER